MTRGLRVAPVALALLLTIPLSAAEPGALPPLTLEEAEARALSRNPAMAAAGLAVRAADALAFQAGRPPNPSLEVEGENFGGSGALGGTRAAEWTISLAQPIPLGGRLRAARELGERDRELAALARERFRLDLLARTRAAFHRARIDREHVALGEEMLLLAERFAETVRLRVEAGRAAPVEALRAEIEVSRARTSLARARRERAAARAALAACWGAASPDFGPVEGPLPTPLPPPAWPDVLAALEATPDARVLAAERRRAAASTRRERTRVVPDLEVRIGRRRLAETGDEGFVASLGLPLPLLDRNRGGRRAALLGEARARLAEEAGRADLAAALRASFERLAAAEAELAALRDEVVPAAERAFALVETGYREGKFGFLEVLDARRDLALARSLLLDTALEVLLARTDLDRRTGGTLSSPGGDDR